MTKEAKRYKIQYGALTPAQLQQIDYVYLDHHQRENVFMCSSYQPRAYHLGHKGRYGNSYICGARAYNSFVIEEMTFEQLAKPHFKKPLTPCASCFEDAVTISVDVTTTFPYMIAYTGWNTKEELYFIRATSEIDALEQFDAITNGPSATQDGRKIEVFELAVPNLFRRESWVRT